MRQRCDLELLALKEEVLGAYRKPLLRLYLDHPRIRRGHAQGPGDDLPRPKAISTSSFTPRRPEPWTHACSRPWSQGVEVKYVSMGEPVKRVRFSGGPTINAESIKVNNKGRVFDLVKDKSEVLVGMFRTEAANDSPINWAKNNWFVSERSGVSPPRFFSIA